MAAVSAIKTHTREQATAIVTAGEAIRNNSVRSDNSEAKLKSERDRDALIAALTQIFTPSATENVVPLRKEKYAHVLEATSRIFPEYTAGKNKIVFSNMRENVAVEEKKITYAAQPIKNNEDVKPALGEDTAYAMALLASKNPKMIEKGILLRGSPKNQELLRVAVEMVNAGLPEGQKLKIRNNDATPAVNLIAAKAVNDHKPRQSEESAEKISKNAEVPTVAKRAGRFSFFPRFFNKIMAWTQQDPQDKRAKEAAAERSVMSRRTVLTGGLAVAAASMIPEDAHAGLFGRSATYERAKAGSGLYPELEKKLKREKARKKETPAQRKKREKAEKSSSRKKETVAQRKKREKEERAAARKKEQQRLKEKAAQKKQQEKAKKVTQKQEAAKAKAEERKAKVQEKRDAKKAESTAKAGHGSVRIVCTHTGSSTVLNFGNPKSCQRDFNRVTQDWRQGVTHNMAPGLITLLGRVTMDLRKRGHSVSEIKIVAGFRTKKTNDMLIKASKKRNGGKSGVAQNSFHKKGMALDFYVAGISMSKLCNSAKRAGAWSYSAGEFVHMDTRGAYRI